MRDDHPPQNYKNHPPVCSSCCLVLETMSAPVDDIVAACCCCYYCAADNTRTRRRCSARRRGRLLRHDMLLTRQRLRLADLLALLPPACRVHKVCGRNVGRARGGMSGGARNVGARRLCQMPSKRQADTSEGSHGDILTDTLGDVVPRHSVLDALLGRREMPHELADGVVGGRLWRQVCVRRGWWLCE